MQDAYCGDAGDFGKYILLNALSHHDDAPVLGVNWYYVPPSGQECGDGNHIAYLTHGLRGEGRFRNYCPALYDQLREIVASGPRCVAEIERRGVLAAGTRFFSEALPDPRQSPGEREVQRRAWHARGRATLAGADIIFLDPDNGITPKSVTRSSKHAMKYAFGDEIADYFGSGSTVVIYNHRDRRPAAEYAQKITRLDVCLGPGDCLRVLRFRRFSVRDYVFLVHHQHKCMVDAVITLLSGDPYSNLFTDMRPHFQ